MYVELDKLQQAKCTPEQMGKRKKSSKKGEGEKAAPQDSQSEFTIELEFLGGLSGAQQEVFELAKSRWEEIIIGDLPSVDLPGGRRVDDVLIEAQGAAIDGEGGILGQAGPELVRNGSNLPAKGMMQFDTADLAAMEANGSLEDVIFHEMGHVLGIGTIWGLKGLLVGCDPATANPVFLGTRAMEEFGDLIGDAPTPVPVANTGGPGTRCGHWRESIFGHELMTGFINAGNNPVSRLTIASMEDLGYEVDISVAEDYILPSGMQLAMMGIGAEGHRQTCRMCGAGTRGRTTPIILPASSNVE